jgi:hypothetical protein
MLTTVPALIGVFNKLERSFVVLSTLTLYWLRRTAAASTPSPTVLLRSNFKACHGFADGGVELFELFRFNLAFSSAFSAGNWRISTINSSFSGLPISFPYFMFGLFVPFFSLFAALLNSYFIFCCKYAVKE